MAKVRNILIILFVTVFAGAGLAFYFYTDTIHMNPDNITGNTPGNLYNGGYFLELDNRVYFRNAYDNGCLYSMDIDETDVTPITTMNVRHINGYGNFLYYYMDSTGLSRSTSGLGTAVKYYGVYRSKLNGTKQVCLDREAVGSVALSGSYVYFQVKDSNLGSLNKIRIDKTNLTKVAEEYIDPSGVVDGRIYYTGVITDHNIHVMDTMNGDTISQIAQGYMFFPIYKGDYIYFLDGANNYHVSRYNTMTGEVQELSQYRADCFNMNDTYIFYAVSNALTPALHVMTLDGTNDVPVIEGIYNSINLTSRYVYFQAYSDDTRLWHMPVNGSAPPTLFEPVVVEKIK